MSEQVTEEALAPPEVETFECGCCHEAAPVDDRRTTEDGDVCVGCRSEHYCECDRCHDAVHNDNTRSVGEEVWCESCSDNHSFTCDDCGERFSDGDGRSTPGVNTVCDSCLNDNYFCCNRCERTFHNDDYGHDGLCDSCSGEDDGPIGGYSDDAPSRKFGTGPHWFGIELEVEVGQGCNRGEKAQECLDKFPSSFAVVKEDGSLHNGFEIVTAPATIAKHLEFWKPFFDSVPSGLKSFNTQTCGLHVHCSREPLSQLQIAKIVCFVNAAQNCPFIECIAGRPPGHYCQVKVKKIGSAHKFNPDRYEAVNLQNADTIEFRIFKGTLKRASFFKAVEFCDALIAFTIPGEQSIEQAMSRDRFIEFVKWGKKRWPHLHAFIKAAWFGIAEQETTEMGFKVQRRVPQTVTDTEQYEQTIRNRQIQTYVLGNL